MNDYQSEDDWSPALHALVDCIEAATPALERLIEIVEASHPEDKWARSVVEEARQAIQTMDKAHDEWAQPIMLAYPPRIEKPFVVTVTR